MKDISFEITFYVQNWYIYIKKIFFHNHFLKRLLNMEMLFYSESDSTRLDSGGGELMTFML